MLMPLPTSGDTHLDCPGSSDFIKRLHREVRDPLENLTCCLQELAARKVAFVLPPGIWFTRATLEITPSCAACLINTSRCAGDYRYGQPRPPRRLREGFLGIPSPAMKILPRK